jgi:type III restriction enzyme
MFICVPLMVINIDAFRKDFSDSEDTKKSNVIFKENDVLSGRKPIEFVQATQPFVIIDEPQSVDRTPKSQEAIKSLNPACIFRFSATHKNPYNLVYKLDPVKAYALRLVKQIVVASVQGDNAHNAAYIKLLAVDNKKGIRAKVRIQVQGDGNVKEKDIWVKQGDDLYIRSNERLVYNNGFEVLDISAEPDYSYIDFKFGRIMLGQEHGGIQEDIASIQIERTIRKHLDKELQLEGKGIKVLSLFFIDKVANYRVYDEAGKAQKGKFAQQFEAHYNQLIALPQYKNLGLHPVEALHNGYFSADKKGVFKDTNGSTQADDDTYSLIMKDKEKLLSMDTPLKFIFSHSALREGWDNPNVFQICTLNETQSVTKKRQEIGRGLRLPVNKDGVRVLDATINKLTVIANESYDEFAASLQKEYEEDCGVTFGKVPVQAFKHLVTIVDGEEKGLSTEQTQQVFAELVQSGILDKNGKITNKFAPNQAGFSLGLSPDLAHQESAVIDILQSYELSRHILKDKAPKTMRLNKQVLLDPDFEILWEKIKHKTTYNVKYATADLIRLCASAIRVMPNIEAVKVVYREDNVSVEAKGVTTVNIRNQDVNIEYTGGLPDLLAYLQKQTELTRRTLVEMLKASGRVAEFAVNPQRFMDQVAAIIKKELHKLMINGIEYERLTVGETYYSMRLFQDDDLKEYFEQCIRVQKSVFETIPYDSEVERQFAEALEVREDIKLFVKLPAWFKIDTPIGTYNPDWAIVKQGDETVYLVRDTNGDTFKTLGGRVGELEKIKCGHQHFAALGVDFEVVTHAVDI